MDKNKKNTNENKEKKDNLLVNILLFLIMVSVLYCWVIMPQETNLFGELNQLVELFLNNAL